jgi:F-type H+-transporting ATPase subunit epsilon
MADSNLLTVELVTPERILLTGVATEVVLRTADGDVTFLSGHTPLIGSVEPGVVRVGREEGEVDRIAVHGGFVQVEPVADGGSSDAGGGTRVTLLAGIAELAGEIDVERAQVALEAAEALVAELAGTPASGTAPGSGEGAEVNLELVEAEAAVRRAQVRIEATDASLATGPTTTV